MPGLPVMFTGLLPRQGRAGRGEPSPSRPARVSNQPPLDRISTGHARRQRIGLLTHTAGASFCVAPWLAPGSRSRSSPPSPPGFGWFWPGSTGSRRDSPGFRSIASTLGARGCQLVWMFPAAPLTTKRVLRHSARVCAPLAFRNVPPVRRHQAVSMCDLAQGSNTARWSGSRGNPHYSVAAAPRIE